MLIFVCDHNRFIMKKIAVIVVIKMEKEMKKQNTCKQLSEKKRSTPRPRIKSTIDFCLPIIK